MRSPRHRLAAPVEKPSVGVRRELTDDGKQMIRCNSGMMYLQSGRREASGQCCGDCARMQGDANSIWRSTGQLNGRGPHELVESRFRRSIGIPPAQPIVADAPQSGGQRCEDRFARSRQPRQHMLHDQRRPDRIQRKSAREIGRIELPPALLGCLAIIMQKSRCIDYQTQLSRIGGARRGMRETGFVQKVDRRRSAATERDYMLEFSRGLDRFNQGPSDTAAGAKYGCHAGLRKRP